MKNETIVDRVVERLKAQPLGDLITEEDLHDIVKEAIPKVFFEKRRVLDGSSYSNSYKEIDPLMVEIMRGLLKDSAAQLAQQWLKENSDLVAGHWRTVIDEGLLKYVQNLQSERATVQVKAALAPLMQELNNERYKLGLGHIFL
jgi:hypothetical protein